MVDDFLQHVINRIEFRSYDDVSLLDPVDHLILLIDHNLDISSFFTRFFILSYHHRIVLFKFLLHFNSKFSLLVSRCSRYFANHIFKIIKIRSELFDDPRYLQQLICYRMNFMHQLIMQTMLNAINHFRQHFLDLLENLDLKLTVLLINLGLWNPLEMRMASRAGTRFIFTLVSHNCFVDWLKFSFDRVWAFLLPNFIHHGMPCFYFGKLILYFLIIYILLVVLLSDCNWLHLFNSWRRFL